MADLTKITSNVLDSNTKNALKNLFERIAELEAAVEKIDRRL